MPPLAATVVLRAGQIAQAVGLAIALLHVGTVDGRPAEDLVPRVLHDTPADAVFERRVEHPVAIAFVVGERAFEYLVA